MRDEFTAWAYGVGWNAVKRLPDRMARGLFERAADAAAARNGRGVQQLARNYRQVLGEGASDHELKRVVRAGMRSYARYWCEAFRLPTYSTADLERLCVDDNIHILTDLIDARQGAIVVLPHLANYDLVGAWIASRGYPFATVAERLEPTDLFDRFVAYRESLGMEVLPADGGAHVLVTLAKRLRAGGLVCLVGDRDLSASGVPVDFFGAPTRMPAGPASLALSTQSHLITADLYYDGPLMRVHLDEVVVPVAGDRRALVQSLTEQVAANFERYIASHPQDWHMLQHFWPGDREARVDDVDEVAS